MRRAVVPLVAVLSLGFASTLTAQTASPAGTAPQGAPRPGAAVPGAPAPGPQRPGLPARDNAQPPQTGTAKLSGRVAASPEGTPLRRAQMTITGTDGRFRSATTTDGEGRYEFKDLPAGRFTVTAAKAGYVQLQYGQRRAFDTGTPVSVADGESLARVDFALPKGSVIVARIVDEFGEPVAGASVQVQRFQWGQDGQRRLNSVSTGVFGLSGTDDHGEIRIFGLMPGEYVLQATLRGAPIGIGGGNVADSSEGFAATFYPGTLSQNEAQPIAVGVGQEISVQFAMVASRLARISGVAVDSEGRPAGGAQITMVTAIGGGFTSYGAGQVAPDGTFSISGIPPGEHSIRLQLTRTGGGGESASIPVVVAGDVTGLQVNLGAGATISGRVVFDGTSPRTGGPPQLRVSAQQANPQQQFAFLGATTDPLANGVVDDEGNFKLAGASGRVFLTVPAPPGWILKSVTIDGEDVTDVPIDLNGRTALSDVRLTLTDKLTNISGQVSDGRGQPLNDYVVIVQPADQREPVSAARAIRLARPDTRGRFEVRGLRPGRYVATAIEAIEQGRQFSPEFQKELRRGAHDFSVREGEAVTLDLKLTPDL
jgi:protocatechuate 3,4-dioxygenase beta subunit